ncbi:Uncharacterised protein [Amycolatopsis camponoti]|uniref:Uncharacterized protein n=1 Tax=Amycolatopsis camponoti TaxID=2606593 RepID=A0A6I8LLA5_9PSEU|nr:Uncharacterised protein [Amycolatopsis camponoti]
MAWDGPGKPRGRHHPGGAVGPGGRAARAGVVKVAGFRLLRDRRFHWSG